MNSVINEMPDDRLLDLLTAGLGTGFDDPGAEVVNGFSTDALDAEANRRGLDVYKSSQYLKAAFR